MTRTAAALLAAAACLLAPLPPAAAGCLDGPWPLERESQVLAAAASAAPLDSTAPVGVKPFQALTLALAPPTEPPATPPAKGGPNGGSLLLRVETPSLYQVTLPEAAAGGHRAAGTDAAPRRLHPRQGLPRGAQERALHPEERPRFAAHQPR